MIRPSKLIAFLFVCLFMASVPAERVLADDAKVRLSLAEEYLRLTESKEIVDAIHAALIESLESAYKRLYTKILDDYEFKSDLQRQRFMESYEINFNTFKAEHLSLFNESIDLSAIMREILAPIYAEMFTGRELEQLIAFMESPTGQKWWREQPKILRLSMEKLGPELALKQAGLIAKSMSNEKTRLIASLQRPEEEP